jgi:hypothetical protein
MRDLLHVQEAAEIANAIEQRQARWDETLEQSIVVVLLNYGGKFIEVSCVNGEWIGTKDDLRGSKGLPRCPSGHPLLETSGGKRLALVDVSLPRIEGGADA